MRDEVVRYQRAGLHQVHGPPDQLGRVVERAEQRELLVMRPPGIQADRGSGCTATEEYHAAAPARDVDRLLDRKSTRLNSSHSQISYAVFCLKKKIKNT